MKLHGAILEVSCVLRTQIPCPAVFLYILNSTSVAHGQSTSRDYYEPSAAGPCKQNLQTTSQPS